MLVVEGVDPRLEFLDTDEQRDCPWSVFAFTLAKVDVRVRSFGIVVVGCKRELVRVQRTGLARSKAPSADANDERRSAGVSAVW